MADSNEHLRILFKSDEIGYIVTSLQCQIPESDFLSLGGVDIEEVTLPACIRTNNASIDSLNIFYYKILSEWKLDLLAMYVHMLTKNLFQADVSLVTSQKCIYFKQYNITIGSVQENK